jgi:hypothetical protein
MRKPTIAELEKILASDEAGPAVQIRTDGTVLIGDEARTVPWPDPTPEMLASPEFEKIWQAIKQWDINVPGAYTGYCGATGNHVRAILDALKA